MPAYLPSGRVTRSATRARLACPTSSDQLGAKRLRRSGPQCSISVPIVAELSFHPTLISSSAQSVELDVMSPLSDVVGCGDGQPVAPGFCALVQATCPGAQPAAEPPVLMRESNASSEGKAPSSPPRVSSRSPKPFGCCSLLRQENNQPVKAAPVLPSLPSEVVVLIAKHLFVQVSLAGRVPSINSSSNLSVTDGDALATALECPTEPARVYAHGMGPIAHLLEFARTCRTWSHLVLPLAHRAYYRSRVFSCTRLPIVAQPSEWPRICFMALLALHSPSWAVGALRIFFLDPDDKGAECFDRMMRRYPNPADGFWTRFLSCSLDVRATFLQLASNDVLKDGEFMTGEKCDSVVGELPSSGLEAPVQGSHSVAADFGDGRYVGVGAGASRVYENKFSPEEMAYLTCYISSHTRCARIQEGIALAPSTPTGTLVPGQDHVPMLLRSSEKMDLGSYLLYYTLSSNANKAVLLRVKPIGTVSAKTPMASGCVVVWDAARYGTCDVCSSRLDRVQVCADCRIAQYCSRECQKKDWNAGQHRRVCRGLAFFPNSSLASSSASQLSERALHAYMFDDIMMGVEGGVAGAVVPNNDLAAMENVVQGADDDTLDAMTLAEQVEHFLYARRTVMNVNMSNDEIAEIVRGLQAEEGRPWTRQRAAHIEGLLARTSAEGRLLPFS